MNRDPGGIMKGADGDGAADCCQPASSRGFTIRKFNKVTLWVVTALVLAFAFFPNYVGVLLGGGDKPMDSPNVETLVVGIDGMTCEACATTIERALAAVPGVTGAEVSYEKGEAVIGVSKGVEVPRAAILSAVSDLGYKGRFVEPVP